MISKSIKSGWLTHGPENKKFEMSFKKYIGAKYALSMNSCTSALECAIKCIEKKGEIIVPSFTWVSSANAIINCGCKPVFVDVERETRNIDYRKIEKLISKQTIAIMVVHFSGLPCEMDMILKICKKYNLDLIEDSAETLGGTYKNKLTGSFGLGCFSFFPTKNITTTEGGMLTLNSKKKYDKAKRLIAHGIVKSKNKFWKRIAVLPGHNYRLPNHLALLGNSQLRKLGAFNQKRNLIAKKYDDCLRKYKNIFEAPIIPPQCNHVYQMYTICIKKNLRNNFVIYMNKKGIEASVHFDPPLHLQNLYSHYRKGDLKNTEILSKEIATLPMYPELKIKELNYIIKSINVWVDKIYA
tara:strand:- start:6095 stop:7156 length:1062 start_codon:yes stop_codon:yes gene_type:complete